MERWGKTRMAIERDDNRRTSYLSLEFLMGRLLRNALLNLDIEEETAEALGRLGLDLEDVYENMGARMVREVASKTSDVAGDGTTTATVLSEAILREGLKAVALANLGGFEGLDPAVLFRHAADPAV